MKNKIIYLLIFIFLLHFCLLFRENNSIYNEQNDKDNGNNGPLLSASNSLAIEWDKTWLGSGYEGGTGVAVDSSDNIYSVGHTRLVKYNSSGIQEWHKTRGGTGVAVDSSDNMYLVNTGLVKFNSSGFIEWITGGGHGVTVDSSDNIYVVRDIWRPGGEDCDISLLKYDSSGIKQWNKTWGGSEVDRGWGVAVDSSDNIYIVGHTGDRDMNYRDIILVKFDSSSKQQWNKTWGGSGFETGGEVVVDSEDNIYITGTIDCYSASQGVNIVLVKYDSLGKQQWNKTWGGRGSEGGGGLAVDSENNIYVVGFTCMPMESSDIVLLKYNGAGVLQWNIIWDGGGSESGQGVAIDSSGNIYIVGEIYRSEAGQHDMVLLKYGIDSDSDDLSDLQEENIYLTDPNNSDTDNDGLLDGEEVNIYSTDPHNPDTDGDGLLDGEEVNIYSSNPNSLDTDGDLIPDGLDPHPSSVDIIIPLGLAGIIMIFSILSLSIYGIRKIDISENSSTETSYNYDLKHVLKAPVKKNFIFSIIFGASLIILFTLQNHILLVLSFIGGLIITLYFIFKYLFSNYPALFEERRERYILYLSLIMFLIMIGNAIWWLTSTYTEVITFSSENLFTFFLSKNSLMLLPLYFIYIIFYILLFYCCKDLIFFPVQKDKTRIFLSLLVSMVAFILFNYGVGFIVVLMNLPLPTYIQGLFTSTESDPIICFIGVITIPALLFQSYFKSVGYLDTITGKKKESQTKSIFTKKLSKFFTKIIKIIFVYLLIRNFVDLFLLLFNFYSPGGSSLLVWIIRFIFGENIIILLISISITIFLNFIITTRAIFSNYFGKSSKTFWQKIPIELKFIITSTVILGVGIIFASEIWSTFQYLGLFSLEFFEPTWILIFSNLVSIFSIFWYLKSKKYSTKKEKDYLIEQQGEAILF